jgi:hypothetical protein
MLLHNASAKDIRSGDPMKDFDASRNWLSNFLADARVLRFGGNQHDYTKLFMQWSEGLEENPHVVDLIYVLYIDHGEDPNLVFV